MNPFSFQGDVLLHSEKHIGNWAVLSGCFLKKGEGSKG